MYKLLVCLTLSTYVTMIDGQFPGCDYFYEAPAGETFYLSSPGYSKFYPGNTNCRWAMTAPKGNMFYTNCYDVLLPGSTGCSADRLELSLTGRTDLADAYTYCGAYNFIVESIANKLVIALKVPARTNGGRFKCQITVMPDTRCDCGRRKRSKIVGGIPTLANEFPMMAGLIDLNDRKLYCGATIISNLHAITAAHCLDRKTISTIALLVGDHDYTSGNDTPFTKLMLLSSITKHPKYTSRPVLNDIALVRTREYIEFNEGVGPVCLPFRFSSASFVNINVEAVGWGTTEFGGPVAEELQKVNLTVIDTQKCASQLPNSGVTNSHICTYSPGKDTCQNDSGGPLFFTDPQTGFVYHVGIVSYGVTCAASKPSVSTRITSYLDWIQENTPAVTYCNV